MFEPNLLQPAGTPTKVVTMPFSSTLIRDLNLDRVLDRITRQGYIRDTTEKYLCAPALDARTIYYRQAVYKDFVRLNDFVEEIFRVVNKTQNIETSRRVLWNQSKINVIEKLKEASNVADSYFEIFEELAELLKNNKDTFESEGMIALADRVCEYAYGDDYKLLKETIKETNTTIEDSRALKLWVEFGPGLKASMATLCEVSKNQIVPEGFLSKLFGGKKDDANDFILVKNYQFGIENDLEAVRKEVILHIAGIITAMTTGMSRFFGDLRTEVSFYMGVAKIIEKAEEIGMPTCFPKVAEESQGKCMYAKDLYDLSMALYLGKPKERITEEDLVFNDMAMEDGEFMIITGPNQGGKTTFLRAAGIAQVLMQAGAPVPASEFTSSISDIIYTHFPEEEDKDMKYGKLAEELARLREAFEQITDKSLILLNDSFATTTTKEGSDIAADITKALALISSRMIFVSHLFEYASTIDELNKELPNGYHGVNYVCEVREEGDEIKRTYKIVRGEPEQNVFVKEFEKSFAIANT